jgi:hypothetical protein
VTDTGQHQAVVVRDEAGGLVGTVVGLVMRPARASRAQQVALVLLALLALGPILAALSLLGQEADPTATVLPAPEVVADDELLVLATVTGVDAVNGELRLRIDPEPGPAFRSEGVLTSELAVRTTALVGPQLQTYPVGSVVVPYEVTLPLENGNVSRYPFDAYDANVLLAATANGETVPVVLQIESLSLDHRIGIQGELAASADTGLSAVSLRIEREWTAIIYGVGVMALMWMFAISGVLVSWSTIIWRVDPPMWVYGFFVGVLFALPPLRNSMPGDPPPGTVVDVVAFYWSIAAVAVTLLLLMASWLRETRNLRGQAAAAGSGADGDGPSGVTRAGD